MTAVILLTAVFYAAVTVYGDSSPVIDYTSTASLTLYKLKENDGRVKTGNGNKDASVTQEGMKGVRFSILKIAEIETVPGGNEIGTYFTGLNAGFLQLLTDNGITAASLNVGGKVCYTTESLAAAMTALNSVTGAEPGEVQVNAYVLGHRSSIQMTETDENGYTKKDGLPLGLYLVAETGTEGYTGTGAGGAKEVISNPSSPFLVSLPMSNQDGEHPDHWQYDVTAYPKNQTVSIPKFLVKEADGKTLVDSDDFEIGETVHQVIAPMVPAVAHIESDAAKNREYETYVIRDTMEAGLSFVRITSVRIGAAVRAPSSTDAFRDFQVLRAGEDYRVLKGDSGTQLLTEANAKGTKVFRVELLASGLSKLNALHVISQIAVFFDAVVTADASDGEALANLNEPSLTLKHANTATATVKGNQPRVYTYRLNLRKQGVSDASITTFTVKRGGQDVSFIKESDGIYHLLDHDLDDAAAAVTGVQPAANGKMVLRGLDADTYTFAEMKTQGGHELLASSFQVTFKGTDPVDGNLQEAVLASEGKSTSISREKGTAGMVVHNRKSLVLRTGGAGTAVFYALAVFVLATAGIFAISGRKRRRS